MGRAPSHKASYNPKPEWAVEQENFQKSTKYPFCNTTFPDCPKEINPDSVHDACKLCPIYKPKTKL